MVIEINKTFEAQKTVKILRIKDFLSIIKEVKNESHMIHDMKLF